MDRDRTPQKQGRSDKTQSKLTKKPWFFKVK
jgi:hypothetical protein